jgi:hypothetical protein
METKIKNLSNSKYKNINKMINPKKNYLLKFIENNKTKLLGFYLDNKLVLSGEYTFYGIYQTTSKLWIWASSIPGISMKNIDKINKIKKMSYLFEDSNNNNLLFYYQLLTNDVLYIENTQYLNLINNLLLYLTDGIYYFNPANSMNNIQFLILNNIKDLKS